MSIYFSDENNLPRCRINRGFTIVEVMVTMMIISVGLLALGKFTGSTLAMDTLAKQRTIAVHVAEELIEEWAATNDLTSAPFSSAPSAPGGSNPTASNSITFNYYPPELNGKIKFILKATSYKMNGPSNTGAATSFVATAAAPTIIPIIQAISVTWAHGGVNRTIVLTHATSAP